MTRGEIVFEVAAGSGLDDTVNSDELKLLQRWVDRGVIDVLLKTKCYVDEGDMTLDTGVTDYRIDTNILSVDTVHIADQAQPMSEKPMAWLDTYLLASPAPDVPGYYSIHGTFLRVAPAPSSDVVMRFFYTPKPVGMQPDGTTAGDAHDPSNPTYGGIPEEYHDAILMYAKWMAAEYDDKGGGFYRGQASAPGSAYRDAYEGRIKEIRKDFRQKGARGMHAAVIGYPDRQARPTRNDQYPVR